MAASTLPVMSRALVSCSSAWSGNMDRRVSRFSAAPDDELIVGPPELGALLDDGNGTCQRDARISAERAWVVRGLHNAKFGFKTFNTQLFKHEILQLSPLQPSYALLCHGMYRLPRPPTKIALGCEPHASIVRCCGSVATRRPWLVGDGKVEDSRLPGRRLLE